MNKKPILFNSEMVRAILDGRKTQTRRVCKIQPHESRLTKLNDGTTEQLIFDHDGGILGSGIDLIDAFKWHSCPYGQPGDQLWVRETWAMNCIIHGDGPIPKELPDDLAELAYRADGDWKDYGPVDGFCPPWRPSIHMPRWASRITLEIISVRVERLQDISEEDSKREGINYLKNPGGDAGWGPPAEGAPPNRGYTHRYAFKELWDSLAKPGADWNANPWVWVIEFKRI